MGASVKASGSRSASTDVFASGTLYILAGKIVIAASQAAEKLVLAAESQPQALKRSKS
jgi:hypothetical protein